MNKQHSGWFVYGAALVYLLAFGLRVLDVTAHSLWFDEAVEYFTAGVPLRSLPQAVVASNFQPPLYPVLHHFWLQISIQPLWLRFLPIVLSMLTVAGLMRWTYELLGKRSALMAGLVVAAMPTEIYYAQDVGEYALLVCALTWSLYFLYLAQKDGCYRYWILWAVLSVASVLSHYGAAIVVVPVALLTLFENVGRKRWRAVIRQLVVASLAVVLISPLLFYFMPTQIRRVNEGLLNNPASSAYEEGALLVNSIFDTFLFNLIGWPFSEMPRWSGVVALVAVLLLGLYVGSHMPRRLVVWFIAAYVFYFFLVRLGLYVGVYGLRYGLIFTPMFVLAVAAVVENLMRKQSFPVGLPALCLILAIELYALPNPLALSQLTSRSKWVPQEQMEGVVSYWQQHRRSDEHTFVYYGAVPAFRYYLQARGVDTVTENLATRPLIECSSLHAADVCVENNLFYSPWLRGLRPEEHIERIERTIGGMPDRLWIIFSHAYANEEADTIRLLEEQYRIEGHYSEGNSSIYLLVCSRGEH